MKDGCGRICGYMCLLLSCCVFVSACLCKHIWLYLKLAHIPMTGLFMKSFKKSAQVPTHISQYGWKTDASIVFPNKDLLYPLQKNRQPIAFWWGWAETGIP